MTDRGRRVAITGIGLVTPIGIGVDAFWASALAGRSGIRRISRYDASPYPTQVAGQIDDLDLAAYPEIDKPKRFGRATQLGVVATRLALADAGLADDEPRLAGAGTYLGSGYGCMSELGPSYKRLFDRGWRRIPALTVPRTMPNAIASAIAIDRRLTGPNRTICNACASSADAIGQAFDQVRSGRLDLAVAGGAEAMLFEGVMAAWCLLRVMATHYNERPEQACRPFDAHRDGMVMSEGAGMLVLEPFAAAQARGATIYAEVRGYGASCDATHMTAPQVEGQARALQLALDDAGLPAEAIDYVSAHGTATSLNDPTETAALKRVLGARASQIPISALKSMTGHTIGAAGVFEAAATALSIRDGRVHPTLNLDTADPACDLDYVPGQAREHAIGAALSPNYAFGGGNAALVLTHPDR